MIPMPENAIHVGVVLPRGGRDGAIAFAEKRAPVRRGR
jgi:hypothetical protein